MQKQIQQGFIVVVIIVIIIIIIIPCSFNTSELNFVRQIKTL